MANDTASRALSAGAVEQSVSVFPSSPAIGESPLRSPLSVLTTLGPPLTIATALMFYFGWARSDAQVTLDQALAPLVIPLVLAGGTATAAYGGVARRRCWPPWRSAPGISTMAGRAAHPACRQCNHARAVLAGVQLRRRRRTRPRAAARQLGDSAARATAFSATSLGIQAPGVREERLNVGPGGTKDTLRYRTTGLRFLVRSGGRMFLLHDRWTPQWGTVIVLPDNDQVHWQFSR